MKPIAIICQLATCFAHIASAADARKPNVIVIVADDLGYGDVSVQGCEEFATPHLDSIAKTAGWHARPASASMACVIGACDGGVPPVAKAQRVVILAKTCRSKSMLADAGRACHPAATTWTSTLRSMESTCRPTSI